MGELAQDEVERHPERGQGAPTTKRQCRGPHEEHQEHRQTACNYWCGHVFHESALEPLPGPRSP
eukprot:127769-Pyramimonas_sp.AAC.1